jgi:hypothetical protein
MPFKVNDLVLLLPDDYFRSDWFNKIVRITAVEGYGIGYFGHDAGLGEETEGLWSNDMALLLPLTNLEKIIYGVSDEL